MFGSKPAPVNPEGVQPADTRCEGPWAFQPYLAQLLPYGAPDASDPWQQGLVRLRYVDPDAGEPKDGELLKEKNWNPFVYKGKLYFTQQFDPHVVIEPQPNGTCTKVFETSSRAFQQLPAKPRGNTQAVLVPAGFSGEPRDFYLGVVHAEINRSYQNFFYKMQARAPTGGGWGWGRARSRARSPRLRACHAHPARRTRANRPLPLPPAPPRPRPPRRPTLRSASLRCPRPCPSSTRSTRATWRGPACHSPCPWTSYLRPTRS
jgi:hypothetical protein